MSSSARPTTVRTLHLYFLRETLAPTAIAFGLYTFLMLMNQLFLLVDYAYKYDVPFASLGRLFLLQVPHVVVLSLPMSYLVGLLVATARWAADSELIALSASGQSLTLLLRPAIALALVFTAITGWFAFDLMPRGNRAITREIFEMFRQNLLRSVKEREFNTRLLATTSLYIDEIERQAEGEVWHGVILDPGSAGRSRREVFFARRAVPSVDVDAERMVLTLFQVTVHGTVPGDVTVHDVRTLDSYTQVLPPPPLLRKPDADAADRSVREQTFAELVALSATVGPDRPALLRLTRVEIHKRVAIPLACLVFAVFGLGVGASARRAGRAFGFVVSLVVFLAYYQSFYAGERLAVTGDVPPWLGMWGGNLLFGALGAFFFHQRATEGRTLNRLRRAWGALGVEARLSGFAQRRRERREQQERIAATRPGRSRLALGFPSILDRYVFGIFARVLILVLGSGVALYIQVTLFQYLDDIFRNHIPLATVLRFYVAWLPEILTYVLPMSVLVATVISLSILTRTNEVTAMLVNGLSLRRIVAPILVAALGLTAVTFLLYDRWLPRSSERWAELDQEIKGIPRRPNFAPARWVSLVGGSRFLHYDSFDRSRGVFYRPALYEVDTDTFTPTSLVLARRGRWEDYRLVFESGAEREFRSGEGPLYQSFDERPLPFLEQRPDFAREWRDPKYMTYAELVAYINWKREHESETRHLSIELRNKRAYPFVTLVMAVIALPFAFIIGRRGSLHGIGIAIVLAAAYWSAVVIATYLGRLGALPPEVAAWSPNVLFATFGLAAFLSLRS